jgi:hypothetical protein
LQEKGRGGEAAALFAVLAADKSNGSDAGQYAEWARTRLAETSAVP